MMLERRWLALAVLGLSVSCAKADREAAPMAKAPSAAEPAPGAAPTANAEEPTPPPAPEVPAEPSADDEAKKKEIKSADKAPSSLRRDEPKTLAEAEAALSKAERDLDRLLTAGTGKSGKAAPLSVGDSRCDEACKAFASLKRAADAVCRLAGETNTRCARARDLVKENEGRVKSCNCADEE
jgi:hypothetical protein